MLSAKKYSRTNVKISGLGASVFAPSSDIPDLVEESQERIDDPASPGAAAKRVNYQKFLHSANDMSMYMNAVEMGNGNQDSPQDVAGFMNSLSPGVSPVKYSDTCGSDDKMTLEKAPDIAAMEIIDTAPMTSNELLFVDSVYVTSEEGREAMRSVVQQHLSSECMDWTGKMWRSCVMAALNITEAAAEFKEVLQDVVMSELSPLLSQTQEADSFHELEPTIDVIAEKADDGSEGSPEDVPVKSMVTELGNETTEEDRVEQIRQCVDSLLSPESVVWPVKTWVARVAEEMKLTELTAEDKKSLRTMIHDAVYQMVSQTQDTATELLGGDEFNFLDDIGGVAVPSEGEGQHGADESSDVDVSLAEEEEDDEASVSSVPKTKQPKTNQKDEKKAAAAVKSNEELVALKAIEEGMNARAQAVHELIYRDKEELENKQAAMRERLLNSIRQKVDPHLKKVNAAAINSLKSIDATLERRSMLKDIVRVFMKDDVISVAETAVKKTSAMDAHGGKAKNAEEEYINLSSDDDSSSDEEAEIRPSPKLSPPAAQRPAHTFVNGGMRMGMVNAPHGIRRRLRAELMTKAADNSAARLATKVGVATSQDLTDVLGYAESVRKTHAAVKADQDRQARQKEEQDVKDKEDRRRQYRERLHAMEQDDSEGEFDENDESFVKPVQSMGAAEHIEDGDVPSEEEVDSQGSDDSSDDEEGNGMDEDAKLAELETREQALAEQETAEKEERARVVARAEEAAVRLSAHKDSVVPSTSDAEEDQDETAGDVDEELDTESYVQHMTAKSTAGATQATEATIVDAEEEEEGEPVVKVRKAAKNERYIKMLMEDGKKKVVPSSVAAFLDEEAEEEEEEGLQRGLLDFGFGKTGDKLDADEEENANKIRKSDYEGIVDEVSDDEGDEMEGAARRMEEERKQDRKLQLKILRNLAEGHMNRNPSGKNNRGHFGIDQLTKGDIGSGDRAGDGGDEDVDEDGIGDVADYENNEEVQGKLLTAFTERAKASRNKTQEESDIELSDDESIDGGDDEEKDAERRELERRERRLRKEKELIMTRSWMEKGRMKSAIHDEGKKKRRDMLDSLDDLDSSAFRADVGDGVAPVARTLKRAKTTSTILPSSQNHLGILEELASLGRPEVVKSSASSTPTATEPRTVSPPGGSMAAPRATNRTGPASEIGFAAPVLPPSMSAVTHHPQIKKSLKRSMTVDTSRPLTIDVRPPSTTSSGSGEFTPISFGSNSNSGFPLSARSTAVPKSVRNSTANGYGALSADTTAHGMGMAFDQSMSAFPEGSNTPVSLSGFGISDSQSGFGIGRKMSFRTPAASAVVGTGSHRGPSPSSAVTVTGQGFVFGADSSSRMAGGGDSNSGFFGAEQSMHGVGNSNSNCNDISGSAPALKRVKSHGSNTSLMGIAGSVSKDNMKRQSSVGSLNTISRSCSTTETATKKNKKSIQDSIVVSGKNAKKPSARKI